MRIFVTIWNVHFVYRLPKEYRRKLYHEYLNKVSNNVEINALEFQKKLFWNDVKTVSLIKSGSSILRRGIREESAS